MKFGEVPVLQAEGCILAHSLRVGEQRFAKGMVLDVGTIRQLDTLGIPLVSVACLGRADLDENTAAALLAKRLASTYIEVTKPFAGRVNLIAKTAGVICVDKELVNALNHVDEAITLATLPNHARVAAGTLIATFKIIPYSVEKAHVTPASHYTIKLFPFHRGTADLILTRTEGFRPSLLEKGRDAVAARLVPLGWSLGNVRIVAHDAAAIKDAFDQCSGDMALILGASATSDKQDVAPAGLIAAGGRLERFGMPVDPGNLLFLGALRGKPVVGLPGCARAPALNGADWVLERLAAGLPVNSDDISAMGVGGLLKETPQRTQPRRATARVKTGKIEVILLAAGKSSRMGNNHKLLREIDGEPLLRRSTKRALESKANAVHVVLAATGTDQHATLNGLDVSTVVAEQAHKGLAASLRAGISALSPNCSGVIIALADMPDVTSADFNALIKAYDPANEHLICAPVAPNGKRGNPVLFDQRYFEALSNLQGDRGAKGLIDQAGGAVLNVPAGMGVLVDLDTPEAWDAWETGQ